MENPWKTMENPWKTMERPMENQFLTENQ